MARRRFTELDDNQWTSVWGWVVAESTSVLVQNEPRVRELVDDAAQSCGMFGGGYIGMSLSSLRRSKQESLEIIDHIRDFRGRLLKYFGEGDGGSDPYDPWDTERELFSRELVNLEQRIGYKIEKNNWLQKRVPRDRNAAKPERDLWMARLVVVWEEQCGLEVSNSRNLQAFLIDALRPYGHTLVSDSAAKHFIRRWQNREVPRPSESISQRLRRHRQQGQIE